MITSFVILPEYTAYGLVMQGAVLSHARFVGDGAIADECRMGRNFQIPTVEYRKVKMTVPDYQKGVVYAIVGLIFPPPELVVYGSGKDYYTDSIRACVEQGNLDYIAAAYFIPLYVTEHLIRVEEELQADCNLFNTPSTFPGKTCMYIPGINELFSNFLNLNNVTSLTALWYWELRNCDVDIERVPQEILDNDLDPDFATLSVCQDVRDFDELNIASSNRDVAETVIEKCCVRKDKFPQSVRGILQMRYMYQLIPLIDKHYTLHPITNSVRTAAEEAYLWNHLIHHVDDGTPRLKTVNNGAMREVLDLASRLPSCDFKLLCRPVDNGFQSMLVGPPMEVFNPFSFGSAINTSPTYIKLCDIIREEVGYMYNYLADVELRIVGSYLEDLWVFSKDGDLIQYIDLFWWNLAAGDGLFNEYLLH